MGLIIHFRALIFTLVFGAFFLTLAARIFVIESYAGLAFTIVPFVFTVYIALFLGRRFLFVIIPLGLYLMSIGLMYFIDPVSQRIIFAFAATLMYYISLLGIVRLRENARDITAHTFLSIATITLSFLFFAVTYGVYINFAVPLWMFLLLQLVVIFMILFVGFRSYVTNSVLRPGLYSLILAFGMVQIGWVANFWPFGYLTAAAINLMFFYILLDMVHMMFIDELSQRRTMTNIIYGAIFMAILLASTRWVLLA